MKKTNEKFEDMDIFQQIDFVRMASLFPAITVMLFLRTKIGYRMVKPAWIITQAGMLTAGALILPRLAHPYPSAVIAFAVTMASLAMFNRWQRWKAICAGERWHSYSPGISFLESLPLPAFLKCFRRVNRFVEPLVVAAVALIVGAVVSHLLGIWLMLSALALVIHEQTMYEKQIQFDLDVLDGLISSEVQAETAEHFSQSESVEENRSLADTAGIPTGMALDIQKQIEARRAKQREMPKDNLVTTGARA